MPERQDNPDPQAEDQPNRDRLGALREWTGAHPYRSAMIAIGLLFVAVGTIATWLYLARITTPHATDTLERALAALDQGDHEYAEALANRLIARGVPDAGGPLFILGAIRAMDSEREWSPERRRRAYLVASRYLSQAKIQGFPVGHEYEGSFLLGKSLIESDQLMEGVEVLHQALEAGSQHAAEIYRLLSEAHYNAGSPRYGESLKYVDKAIAAGALPPGLLSATHFRRAQILLSLGRYDEALAAIPVAQGEADAAKCQLIEGQARLACLESQPGDVAGAEKVLLAEKSLQEAERLDRLATRVTGAAKYLLARLRFFEGRDKEGFQLLKDVRLNYPAKPEGIAASLLEARRFRMAGKDNEALEAYRRTITAIKDPASYRSEWLPIAELRSEVVEAHSAYIGEKKFGVATRLLDWITPIFTRDQQLELKAGTLKEWGDHLLVRAGREYWPARELQSQGRARLREAGIEFESLAKERFGTRLFPDHLWSSGEAYYRGQSYSNAIRVLRDYLRHEPQRRNAQALLRLGQSLLARGSTKAAVDVFEECMEFHPHDAALFRARLDCAVAYRDQGGTQQAEALLLANLVGSTLTPRSPEWRDSLFGLGRLLYDVGRYEEAIPQLELAVDRYPDDRRRRLAQYMMAEAHRHSAEAPMERFRTAETVNERQRNRRKADAHLVEALRNYEEVQRELTLQSERDSLEQATLRNCYTLKGAVLFDLGRYHESVKEYSYVANLYHDDPFVLETLVQISNCWRRLNEGEKSRGALDQAILVLGRLPPEADFASTTTLSRNEWGLMLNEMKSW